MGEVLDERSQMIIEHKVGTEMINTIFLSHLLFINLLSAIMAWARIIRTNTDKMREQEEVRWREGKKHVD